MKDHEITVLDVLERTCQRFPKNVALALPDGKTVNYEDLAAKSRQAGAAIAATNKGDTVALFFPMLPEFVVAYLGALYANKCVLPLNLLLPPEELKWILTDANAGSIVAPPELAPKVAPLGLPVLNYAELFSSPLKGEQKGSSAANSPPLEKGGQGGSNARGQTRPTPDDVCTLLYTSGTTGKPKGVMLTHRNLASNAASAIDAMRLEPSSRFLGCLPTFHSFAITATMLAPIAAGASLATLPKFDPEAVLTVAANLKCDTLMMVPSMYRLVTRMQERRPQPLKIRLAISGAEALPSEVRDRFEKVFGLPLLEGYGQTETSPVVSFNMPWANKPGTVGKPIKDVKVRIVDPASLQELPADTTGEIWISGPNVMKGYRNRPEETAKVLTPEGWLRTGDMGELSADGYIRITGRLREMIKVAGEMVFPAEVEHALLTHPAVFEAGVAGAKDERKGEIVKAFVVLKPDQKTTEEELLQHCRANLASYKVPKAIEFRPELPKGPTGKVLRRLLK